MSGDTGVLSCAIFSLEVLRLQYGQAYTAGLRY